MESMATVAVYSVDAETVFGLLASSRRALHPLDRITRLFGSRSRRGEQGEWEDLRVDPECIAGAVATLYADGKVELWEVPDAMPAVILSASSAELLGIELSTSGRRWRARGATHRAARIRRRERVRRELADGMDFSDADGMSIVVRPPKKAKGIPGVTHFTKQQICFYWARLRVGARLLGPATPDCPWCEEDKGCRAWR